MLISSVLLWWKSIHNFHEKISSWIFWRNLWTLQFTKLKTYLQHRDWRNLKNFSISIMISINNDAWRSWVEHKMCSFRYCSIKPLVTQSKVSYEIVVISEKKNSNFSITQWDEKLYFAQSEKYSIFTNILKKLNSFSNWRKLKSLIDVRRDHVQITHCDSKWNFPLFISLWAMFL